jgi:hypothetical protein
MATEKGIAEIEAILHEHPSLLWHHCPNSQRCHGTPGMPDFIIIGSRGGFGAEVKPHAGEHPRGGQVAWKYGILALGLPWTLWTQADIDSGRVRREIESVL